MTTLISQRIKEDTTEETKTKTEDVTRYSKKLYDSYIFE